MKRSARTSPPKKPAPAPLDRYELSESLQPVTDEVSPGEIVARPDGYHWIPPDGKQEFGPFETLEQAQAYRDASDDGAPAPAETLQEAEGELGIGEWIDPETGELAEGSCPPRLEPE